MLTSRPKNVIWLHLEFITFNNQVCKAVVGNLTFTDDKITPTAQRISDLQQSSRGLSYELVLFVLFPLFFGEEK
jgi:hypothetical protein